MGAPGLTRSVLFAAPLPLAIGAVLLLVTLSCGGTKPLAGTVMDPARDAPDFSLHDQDGKAVSLDTYDGDVTVVTFLYTYCPDVCPAVTSHLRDVQRMLGEDAARVDFVAISVDPERDTSERAREYLDAWGLTQRWAFLVGSEEELSGVWRGYFVDPTQIEWERDQPTVTPQIAGSERGVAALLRDIAVRYEVNHAAPVYLLDREKRMRSLHTPPLSPKDIAHDIRLLLR